MNKQAQELWQKILQFVDVEFSGQNYQPWLNPAQVLGLEENVLKIGLPHQFFRDWIIQHYGQSISAALKKVSLDLPLKIEWSILPSEASKYSHAEEEVTEQKKAAPQQQEIMLNPRFTFDNFVIGPSNLFAHAASLAISKSPAKAHNPLFLYGAVGLGKTHLMQAIGWAIHEKSPQLKIIYMSSEKFTNQFISALQNRAMAKFQQKYRNVDVLLIDDIHFLAGKESTQEEFFHTFNTLYEAHKQVVLTSDRFPKDIPALEERLVSRFQWGLVADIQPPDKETRIAILRKKAEKEGIYVPDEVTYFIAEKIKNNIRELEGAQMRVVAYSSLTGKEIGKQLAEEVLRDMLKEEKKLTIDAIQKGVAEFFDLRLSDMKAKRRTKTIAMPRQMAMYLARKYTDFSLPEIGEYFGGRDHTTVLYAINKIEQRVKKEAKIKELVERILEQIKK